MLDSSFFQFCPGFVLVPSVDDDPFDPRMALTEVRNVTYAPFFSATRYSMVKHPTLGGNYWLSRSWCPFQAFFFRYWVNVSALNIAGRRVEGR